MTEIKDKITLLSTSANVISKMTAFVAVDKNSKVEGQMVKRSCPVPLATIGFQPQPQQNLSEPVDLVSGTLYIGPDNEIL